jgi:NitT/TauT family transport system permease protein
MSWFTKAQDRAPLLVALVPLAIVWTIVGHLEVSFAIPPLEDIWEGFNEVRREPGFTDSLAASLRELGLGLALTLGVGIPLGVAMGMSKIVEEAFDFWVNMMMGAPTAAFVPILVAVFGVGTGAIIATVFVFSVFILIVNTHAGVRSVDARLVEMSRSFGASRALLIRRVVLPGAMPMLLAGLRLAFGRAVAGMVLGEMLVVVVGFGGLIMQKGSGFQVEQLWALIFVVLIFSMTVSRALEAVQDRTTRWSSTRGAS